VIILSFILISFGIISFVSAEKMWGDKGYGEYIEFTEDYVTPGILMAPSWPDHRSISGFSQPSILQMVRSQVSCNSVFDENLRRILMAGLGKSFILITPITIGVAQETKTSTIP
jgi:hypothetical protein